MTLDIGVRATTPTLHQNQAEKLMINVSTKRSNKNIVLEKLYHCGCSSCTSVGLTNIIKKYVDFENILIEDKSSRIFDVFTEKIKSF